MVVTWYNKAKCDGCSDILWTEHPDQRIACICGSLHLTGEIIDRGSSASITDEEVESAILNNVAYSHIENLTVEKWQSQ
jgi:hypothetical protein